jgi:hypothetical protein
MIFFETQAQQDAPIQDQDEFDILACDILVKGFCLV